MSAERASRRGAENGRGRAMTAGHELPRVVVTGVGVVSPIGLGVETFWQNLVHGRSGIGPLSSAAALGLPSRLAAEIRDFDPTQHIYHRKFIKVMSRDIQLGVAAASMAMKDAGLSRGGVDPERLGVEFGAGHIATTPEELNDAAVSFASAVEDDRLTKFAEDGMREICPLWLLKQLPNMAACHVAIEHEARGPNNTITACESSALLALSEAMGVIYRDAADVMIVGACSSHISPIELMRQHLYESLSREADPTAACRPFDRYRDGTVIGEGGGAFVLERYEHAVRRGAPIYAEIVGVGAGCDGTSASNRSEGMGLVRAIQSALRQANIDPKQVGHINAHGKATQRDDWAESRAYHNALGQAAEKIPVTALKSYFGHFDAGAGAVELAGSLLAMRHGVLPITLNYRNPDPLCRLNVVHDEPVRLSSPFAISVNRTRMGQSAAAIIRAVG
jgi:3-oxoacyl-[acyl-carrier-protein] synthase II